MDKQQSPFEKGASPKQKPDMGPKEDQRNPANPDAGVGATEDQVQPVGPPKGPAYEDEPKEG